MPAASKNRPEPEQLRALYVDQRLTAAGIAEQCHVEKITVLRWLKAAGIERRANGHGLANRGIQPPTTDEMRRMIHEEHIGLSGVAKRYGVDYTAVGHWLDQNGIPRPTIWQTRRRGVVIDPNEEELRSRLAAGQTLTQIADDLGVSRTLVRDRCSRYGVEPLRDGWQKGKRFTCEDGHLARSTYELRVDNWLTEHGIEHQVEPTYPWDRRYRADFLVGQTYVEVWGVVGNPTYQARRAMKIERCKAEEIDLIQIGHWQFAGGRRWWKPLEQLVGESS